MAQRAAGRLVETMLLLALAGILCLMVGCNTKGRAHAEFEEPHIDTRGPIQTFDHFVAATEKSEEEYEALFARPSPDLQAVRVVREMAVLPSKSSRRYAGALANALTSHGIKGVDKVAVSTGAQEMTYEELARVTALTGLLKQDTYSETEIPRQCWMDMLRAMVASCPSEDAMLEQVAMSLLLEYSDWYKQLPEPRVRSEWKELVELALKRGLRERPEAFYSTISAGGLFGAGEFLFSYWSTIDTPSGHDVQDLMRKVAQRNRQIVKLKLPVDYVERIKQSQEALAWEFYRKMDAALLDTKSAEKALKNYCAAVNRGDQAAQNALLVYENGGSRNALLGGSGSLSVDYVMLGFGGTSFVARFVVTEGFGFRVVPVELSATRGDGKWRITRVGAP